jgi:hypothetical protein
MAHEDSTIHRKWKNPMSSDLLQSCSCTEVNLSCEEYLALLQYGRSVDGEGMWEWSSRIFPFSSVCTLFVTLCFRIDLSGLYFSIMTAEGIS